MPTWRWSDIKGYVKVEKKVEPAGPMARIIPRLAQLEVRELETIANICGMSRQTLENWRAGKVRAGYADKVECVEIYLRKKGS